MAKLNKKEWNVYKYSVKCWWNWKSMLANHMYYKITWLLHGYPPPIFLFLIKKNSKNSTHPFYDPLFITCARVSIPKIRILAQILRPVYIFPKKSKLKITYILKCMEILNCHTSLRKNTIDLAPSEISYFWKSKCK